MLDSSVVRATNREFLDTYLEYGIGHYYTIAKLLSSRASEEIDEADQLPNLRRNSNLSGVVRRF